MQGIFLKSRAFLLCGFVYQMLGLPTELYTPIFAIARSVGWSAHRME
jgi:citrate synthase